MGRLPARALCLVNTASDLQHNNDSKGLPVSQFLVPWLSKVKVRELSAAGVQDLVDTGIHVNRTSPLAQANGTRARASPLQPALTANLPPKAMASAALFTALAACMLCAATAGPVSASHRKFVTL